jgi:ABC-type polysaccharide/polyol phosphate export permease
MRPPENVLMLLSGWGLLAWFGIALALFIGGLSVRNEVVEKFWHPMTYLLFPISGAAFMVEWLPPAAREVVLWIPMVHGVEMLRGGYFGPGVRVHYDVSYLASFCLLLSLLGLGLTRTIPAEMDSA